MKLNIDSIKEIDPKMVGRKALRLYNNHSITMLFVIGLLVIGFSLLRVKSLTELASDTTSTETSGLEASDETVLQKIDLDEATVERLESIKDDTDVIIDSNLPIDRVNPF